MPELRKDPISGRWVVIASERGKRPSDFKTAAVGKEAKPKSCPFCVGNEKMTPPEIIAWRSANSKPNEPGWDIRVTANKFPALIPEGEISRYGSGILDYMSGIGTHEVIIETPQHDISLAEMEDSQVEKILWAYKQRITDIEKDNRFRYVLVFRNYGKDAGASLAHPHSQLIATPITPRYVKLELATSREYFLEKERCVFCDLLRQEVNSGERIVAENEHFVALAPFASRFPFELWIFPRQHHAGFQDLPDEERVQLARMLKDILGRLMKTLNDPPYNYVLHTAPNAAPRPGRPDYWGTLSYDFHWHIEIIPRLTKMAGFEWGSGLYINPTPPEKAAKYLREISL
jgi:UDPglucose--hexose-1-phosphate uridylyltransferase